MTATPESSGSTRNARHADETTVGMADASEKRRLNRKVRNLACLVVISGASIGEKIALAKDRYLVGRQADADICFDDALVSRRHAELLVAPEGVVILRDLGSRNGTYCNEQKITERELRDGDLLWIGGSVLKYVAPDSAESLYVNVMSDRARLDGLTGLLNRRTLEDYLERIFQRCRALHEPLSVAMVDVDHFKRVNDEWGHQAGDFVLKEIASLLKHGFRPTDLLARYGGEEFGLILPYTNEQEALTVGERIRSAVAAHRFEFREQRIHVTISVGIAELSERLEAAPVLIGHADRALYAAKQRGRNQTVCFSAT
ncbi:MAG: GGDEF domain-containing protein [Nitrospirota bacterium]